MNAIASIIPRQRKALPEPPWLAVGPGCGVRRAPLGQLGHCLRERWSLLHVVRSFTLVDCTAAIVLGCCAACSCIARSVLHARLLD
eukprot:scaffold26724_cov120-Isochrysis_galbana.AAC.5